MLSFVQRCNKYKSELLDFFVAPFVLGDASSYLSEE